MFGNFARIASANFLRLRHVRRARLAPDHVRVRGVREPARDRGVDAALDPVEALGGALAGLDERAIALVDVARQELRAVGVGPRDEDRRNARHVGREARSDQRANERARRDEHLAAHVAALLLARELVLEVNAGGARLDHRLHQLERVERAAESRLGVGDDRREPVALALALAVLDLIGALERRVDSTHDGGHAVRGIERLVRVHLPGEVRVGGDLPAREVDGLQPGAHHLHGLVARERAERGDERLRVEQLPEAVGAERRERVLDVYRAAQPFDVCLGVRTNDAFESRCVEAFGGGGCSRSGHGAGFSYFSPDAVTDAIASVGDASRS